ncbi:hypothetical protein CP49_15085 [Bradyrhizobium valentinum]|uniref:Uncharacterized protein n=1 Tax=Bradyrhizobium valentinum TaxID=1518501 RepID=A0A0R3L7U3_9BRAD|nr:hypothetical protein CP49_15085 [Bradyrhizobium valentinum]
MLDPQFEVHKPHFLASQILFVMLTAGMVSARPYEARIEIPIPKPASAADNACTSAAAYSLTHAEAEMLPYIKSWGGNPNKIVCEETIRIMQRFDPRASTYGLTCTGSP